MSDSSFRKNMIRIFSKSVSEAVICRKFKENTCHLCKVDFFDEKSAWKHYYGSLHSGKIRSIPKMEQSLEFWVMILRTLGDIDPKLVNKKELIDLIVDRFDVRENYSMACINDKVDSNLKDMIDYFQTVKKTGNLYGLKQRGRQELQKMSGKRFLDHENRQSFGRDDESHKKKRKSGDDKSHEQQEHKRRKQEDENSSNRSVNRDRVEYSDHSSRKERKRSSEGERQQEVTGKTPSPKVLVEHKQQEAPLQIPQQHQPLAPQQPGPTRPIIILPPNLNLSSLPQNLLSSLGPALSQMLAPQQFQSHPIMFPYAQQVQQQQQHSQTIISSNSNKPNSCSIPSSKPVSMSPRSHYKMFVQQHQKEPHSARV